MAVNEILFIIIYCIVAVSFIMRDQLWLRAIYSIGTILTIVAWYFVGGYYLIAFQCLFLVINTVQITRIILERKPVLVPKKWKNLYKQTFSSMTPREFILLFDAGKPYEVKDASIMKQGDIVDLIYVIVSGYVSVIKDGKEIIDLGPGSFLGEMRFLSGEPISADIKAKGEVTCYVWSELTLRRLEKEQPILYIKMQRVIGEDLVYKLRCKTSAAA